MKKINILLFATAIISLTSCLKDGKVNLAPGASPAVVEWSTAVVDIAPSSSVVGTPYVLYTTAYDLLPSVTQALQVGYTGGGTTPTDIAVTVAVDPAALLAYNIANFGPASVPANAAKYYQPLPTSLFTLVTSTTIPAGGNKGNLSIKFNTLAFDLTLKYALALKITNISGTSAPISGNYGTIIIAPNGKNKYDGTYSLTSGTFADNLNSTFGFQKLDKMTFRTQTATSVALYDGQYAQNNYAHPFLVTAADGSTTQSSYGSYSPQWNMDPATDKVIGVTNYFGQPASNGRSARLETTGINQWTISGNSKVLKVSYWLQGPGFVDRTLFVETWTYTGPR